ncbi:MAG: hypothetical protein ACK42K_07745, partial [Leptonema sp. (in: bacteria)]
MLSDSLIHHIALNKEQLTYFQNVKGIFFIISSSILIYIISFFLYRKIINSTYINPITKLPNTQSLIEYLKYLENSLKNQSAV